MREENFWGVAVTLFSIFLLIFSIGIFLFSHGSRETSVATDPESVQEYVWGTGRWEPDYESFHATAYSISGTTFSGVKVAEGIVAADPKILPIGSVLEVRAGQYSGIYTVLDTGLAIRGRIIDIYLQDYNKAVRFGRQRVKIRVLRRGWSIEGPSDAPGYSLAG